MPSRASKDANSILDTLHPTISIAVGLCGVCVWVYTTFVTVNTLNAQVSELNARIQDRYNQAIEHSDSNYAKMSMQMSAIQAMMVEMRDGFKLLQVRMYERGRKD